jgi:hypothetical protein
MSRFQTFLLKAALVGAIAAPVLAIPSFAQQEVDPTWYDPWATLSPAARLVPSAPAPSTTPKLAHAQTQKTKAQARKRKSPTVQRVALKK